MKLLFIISVGALFLFLTNSAEAAKLDGIELSIETLKPLQRRQESLKGCSMSSLDKCYGTIPPDGSAPNDLLEEIGHILDAQTCQRFCNELYNGTCQWFMYDKTTKDCKLFSSSLNDLWNDCREVGYARLPDHELCDEMFLPDSSNGCYNFREDYCRFEFSLLENLEEIESLSECQLACQYINNCSYFVYDSPSKICKLNTQLSQKTCDIIHGTPQPDLNTCISAGKIDWASNSTSTRTGLSNSTNGPSGQPLQSTERPETIEYEYLGRYGRHCKNAEGNKVLTCYLSENYQSTPAQYPGPNCTALCDSAASCIAIGTHYKCDRLYFSDYDTALTEVPTDMCRMWLRKDVEDNQIFCEDIDNNDCGVATPTVGCFVKRAKTGQ